MIAGSCVYASHIIAVVKHIIRWTNQAVLLFSSCHQSTRTTLSHKCSSVNADVANAQKYQHFNEWMLNHSINLSEKYQEQLLILFVLLE